MKRKDIEKAADEYVLNPSPEWRSGIQAGCINEKLAFIAGAEWEAKQSPWISVKDMLPEPGKEVLLYDNHSLRHYVIGWLREKKGYNSSMWALTNGYVKDNDITHWMPIPEFNK